MGAAMDRDPRERGGVTRSDASSLWIDFLLLPQKLEEHLAAGAAAIPTPPDLISMFLEQALVNHKAVHGSNSAAANSSMKDAETKGAVRTTSRTASLLCERAARVAVVIQLTLSHIESHIPSQLHQFILLKALIKHDKSRSLLHQCNLHRWLIHKALQCHPIGSASPNVVVPVNRLGSWAGDDLGEVFHGVTNGNVDAPTLLSAGDSRVEEEQPSVEFLEKILHEEELAHHGDSSNSHTDSDSLKVIENGGSNRDQSLSISYKCLVVLDVGEVHFMRGRIRRAYEFFMKCGEMVTLSLRQPSNVVAGSGTNLGSLPSDLIIPEDRLGGFIIACKMLLGSSGNTVESKRPSKCAGMKEPCCVGSPSRSQWVIAACERSRRGARMYGSSISSRSDLANGVSRGSVSSPGKENVGATVGERTSLDTVRKALEDCGHNLSNRRSKKRSYLEGANGELSRREAEIEEDENSDRENVRHITASGHTEEGLDDMQLDEVTVVTHSEVHLSNGGEVKVSEKKSFELEANQGSKPVAVKDSKTVVAKPGETITKLPVDTLKKEPIAAVVAAAAGSEVKLFVDLKADPTGDLHPKTENIIKPMAYLKDEKSLVQTFVEDILAGHLSWGYCLSVERDPLLSKPVRSKLAACNVVRSVLEGAPVESFLRVSDNFGNSEDAVEFLMQLLLAINVMQEGNRFSDRRPSGADLRQNGRLEKLGFFKNRHTDPKLRDRDGLVVQRVWELAMYVCCIIDKPWCWGLAVKHGLLGHSDLPSFSGLGHNDKTKEVSGAGSLLKPSSELVTMGNFPHHPRKNYPDHLLENDILLRFVQVDTLHEMEALVGKVQQIIRAVDTNKEAAAEVNENILKFGHSKTGAPVRSCEHGQSPIQTDFPRATANPSQDASHSWLTLNSKHPKGNILDMGMNCQAHGSKLDEQTYSSLPADVAAILQRRAFNALETAKDVRVAKRLYELALLLQPKDYDSAMMLWLLESADSEGHGAPQVARVLPAKYDVNALPTLELLDFAILQVIEQEKWGNLHTLCKWAASLIVPESIVRDGEKSQRDPVVGPGGVGGAPESIPQQSPAGWQFKQKRVLQTLNVARTVVDLMPLCWQLQQAASRNHFNEDIVRLGSTLSQLFEELMCVLIGSESDGHVQGQDDSHHWRGNHSGVGTLPHAGAAGVMLISRISNPRVLMALGSLTAGWLQRCNVLGLTSWPIAVERYGVLAAATAGAALTSPLTHNGPGSLLRPVPPRVSPEFGRDLFGVLLEGIIGLPGVVEEDREKGHRWIQGLADLAFEEEAYVKALRLYLQAGAMRSGQYCDRASSMHRDIFTPWVIQRMVAACRTIGASMQAVVLCQCLPVPDHEMAFRILQENVLITDRDAAAYFECIWEVPVLELLVHLHSKAGDEARVASLIGLLQQPALNVHNPPAIRQAHIHTMEQRFLQRFAGELL